MHFRCMPRYYFDLRNDVDVDDEEGRELPDMEAVRAAALAEAREMIAESVHTGRLHLGHRIQVRDEFGTVVHITRFADALEVVPAKD